LKSSSAKTARSSSRCGSQTVSSSSRKGIGTSRQIVVSRLARRNLSPHSAIFSPCLPPIRAALSRMFSTVPHSRTSLQALFSPMPGTPGMLSDASPHRARMSRTSTGSSMPYFSRIASRPTISIAPSAPFCLYIRQLFLTSWP